VMLELADTLEEQDDLWMREALELARRAGEDDEVPVGAIVVRDGEIIGRGWNRNIGLNDPSAHAEIMAMRDAGETIANHRLKDCSLYVTLEPCPMCAGAMIHARLDRIIFGASDPKTGAAGGKLDLLGEPAHNHKLKVSGGCLAGESSALLKDFFRQRR
jgi:tRNA(adenine34) deaminase